MASFYEEDEYYDGEPIQTLEEENNGENDYNAGIEINIEMKPRLELLSESFESCLLPSVKQLTHYVAVIVLSCLAFRLISTLLHIQKRYFGNSLKTLHIASIACGIAALYFILGIYTLLVIVLSLFGYILLHFLRFRDTQNIGYIIAIVTIGSQFIFEFLWQRPEIWNQTRGVHMIVNMKIISLAFDMAEQMVTLKTKISKPPSFLAFLGYTFCPATCPLGPWITYQAYINSLSMTNHKNVKSNRFWKLHTILNILIAVACGLSSNCLAPIINIKNPSGRIHIWLNYLTDAFSVRLSHYFICFLSQAGMAAAGITINDNIRPNKLLGYLVTKPWRIEFPRSLNSVVRYWNLPMHEWLKKYVYGTVLQCFPNKYFVAILSTYLISSLLHGFHIRIFLILLSLGAFTYVEYLLRAALAHIFNACITANQCKHSSCTYNACISRLSLCDWRAWILLCVNIYFSILTIFYLSYLGVMLSDDNDNVLHKWKRVGFLNHYIAICAYAFYLFIT